MTKARRYQIDGLLDAMSHTFATQAEAAVLHDLKSLLTSKIEHHQRMIKTLEWFSAHVKLDDPEGDDLLVGKVIVAGLEALYERNLKR